MASPSDTLLADLDDLDELDQLDHDVVASNVRSAVGNAPVNSARDPHPDTTTINSATHSDLKSIARVYYSKTFRDLQQDVDHFRHRLATDPIPPSQWPQDDRDREYSTMVAANQLLPDIDNDLAILHKFVIDEWGPRFPELSSLVRSPLDYLRTVQALGPDLLVSQDQLRSVLPEAVVLSVSLALSTNDRSSHGRASSAVRRGRSISVEAQARTQEACSVAMSLDSTRATMLAYIESRMTMLSPNLSALVGTSVAARLIGASGGLDALCRIPACNIMVIGQSSRRGPDQATAGALGFSSISQNRHRGFVWDSEFVSFTPYESRRKAARLISAKVCLAARMDMNRSRTDGSYGLKLKGDIERQLEKSMAPPPLSSTKALPIPDEAPKKRRGGRRARKLKEQYAVTDLAKAANRVQFGVAEEEVLHFEESEGLGMLGTQGTTTMGKVRAPAVDRKSKAKTSDKLNKKLRAIGGLSSVIPGTMTSLTAPTPAPGTSTWALAGGFQSTIPSSAGSGLKSASGTSTSLAFSQAQGLEFADPLLQQEKVMAANDRWFNMGFMKKKAS